MADAIKLPPLPQFHTHGPVALNPEGIRARDLEVVGLVLKAAADLVDGNAAYCSGQTAAILGANADAIRKMEVSHHE